MTMSMWDMTMPFAWLFLLTDHDFWREHIKLSPVSACSKSDPLSLEHPPFGTLGKPWPLNSPIFFSTTYCNPSN